METKTRFKLPGDLSSGAVLCQELCCVAPGMHRPMANPEIPEHAEPMPNCGAWLAASKLQSVYRGHKSRRQFDDITKHHQNATRLQAAFRGHRGRSKAHEEIQSRQQRRQRDEFVTRLQAAFRGHRTRERVRVRVIARIEELREIRPRRRIPFTEELAHALEELGLDFVGGGRPRELPRRGRPPWARGNLRSHWMALVACAMVTIGLPRVSAATTQR